MFFSSSTDEDLAAALTRLPASDIGGLVLDLRDNPGGLLDSTSPRCASDRPRSTTAEPGTRYPEEVAAAMSVPGRLPRSFVLQNPAVLHC